MALPLAGLWRLLFATIFVVALAAPLPVSAQNAGPVVPLCNSTPCFTSSNPAIVTTTAPAVLTPLGYQQITSLSASTALTVPTGATFVVIEPDATGKPVRWRDDGTAPTASIGMELAAGQSLSYSGTLSVIRFIQESASATLNVAYYK